MTDISLNGITKRFGDITAVDDMTLEIADGEFVVLLGPTGAGKTTTLRLIAGLEAPDNGTVAVDGRDATRESPAERDVAFVFQQYSLYPHLSVYDNLAFPLRSPARRVSEDEIARRIGDIAKMLHIESKLNNAATKLSGGEMQRVAIGRALVRQPSIFLMDEPLSSLDAKLRAELRLELKRIHTDLGATILYVTHDQIEAMTMADRIGVIQDGCLVQVGTPREIYEMPCNRYVAQRLGSPRINILPAGAIEVDGMPAGTETVGARTEHFRIAAADAGARARVNRVEHLGDQNHLHLSLGEHELIVLADPASTFGADDMVALSLVDPIFFDASGARIAAR